MGLLSYLKKRKRHKYLLSLDPYVRWSKLTKDEIIYWGLSDPEWKLNMATAITHLGLDGALKGKKKLESCSKEEAELIISNIKATKEVVETFSVFILKTRLKFWDTRYYNPLFTPPTPLSTQFEENRKLTELFINIKFLCERQKEISELSLGLLSVTLLCELNKGKSNVSEL